MSELYFVKKVHAGLIQERRLRQLDAEGVLKSRQYVTRRYATLSRRVFSDKIVPS